MQFREQGRKVQVIRNTYVPELGRSRQKVVATFDRSLRTVPQGLKQHLTPEEWDALFHWWHRRCNARATQVQKELCKRSVDYLRTLEQALWLADTDTLDFAGIRALLGEIEARLQYLEKRAKRLKRKPYAPAKKE